MKHKIHIFILFFSFLSASSFQQITQDHISVYFEEKDRIIAGSALQTVYVQQDRLQKQYRLSPRYMHIYIAPDENSYRQMAGSSSPLWSAGLASGDRMLIKSPSFSGQTLPAFRKTLRHETVHLSLSAYDLPVWFEEGLAQYESGDLGLSKIMILSRAAWQRQFIPFRDIEQLTRMSARDAELAYAQSLSAIDHLIRHFGVELLARSLDLTKTYDDFNKGFRNAYLMSAENYERLWREYATKRYRFYLFTDLGAFFWPLTVVLFILGYFLTRLRRRKLLKQWERDERESEPGEINHTE
jgi:hypothetical protein